MMMKEHTSVAKANGNRDNHVMWRFSRSGYVPTDRMALEALLEMDKCLINLKADNSAQPLAQKVKAKPATAFGYFVLSKDATQSNKVSNMAICKADRCCSVVNRRAGQPEDRFRKRS